MIPCDEVSSEVLKELHNIIELCKAGTRRNSLVEAPTHQLQYGSASIINASSCLCLCLWLPKFGAKMCSLGSHVHVPTPLSLLLMVCVVALWLADVRRAFGIVVR